MTPLLGACNHLRDPAAIACSFAGRRTDEVLIRLGTLVSNHPTQVAAVFNQNVNPKPNRVLHSFLSSTIKLDSRQLLVKQTARNQHLFLACLLHGAQLELPTPDAAHFILATSSRARWYRRCFRPSVTLVYSQWAVSTAPTEPTSAATLAHCDTVVKRPMVMNLPCSA